VKHPKTPRRRPKQARARATAEAIIEATAQILEKHGEAAFTTNRIAEKAGVSIGSLYQYFPNKHAILRALAMRETYALYKATREFKGEEKDRLFVERLIGAFPKRPRLRRIVVKNLTADVAVQPAEKLGSDVDHTASLLAPEFRLSRMDGYVLSRAVIGVVRAAVIEDSPDLHKPEFAEALVALMRAYRDARAKPKPMSPRIGLARPVRQRSKRGRA
jgi:AcrR family transcriptional regulator